MEIQRTFTTPEAAEAVAQSQGTTDYKISHIDLPPIKDFGPNGASWWIPNRQYFIEQK